MARTKVIPADRRPPVLNLATAFTLLRVALVPVFAWLIWIREPPLPIAAAVVFAVAAATDSLDGYVARRLNVVSGFGQFLDPLADKFLVVTALVALAADDRMPWWVVFVILAREVGVSLLRVALARSGRSLPAGAGGKAKTVVQIVAVVSLTLLEPGHAAAAVVLAVAVVLTVGSGLAYAVAAARGRGAVPWQ